MKEDMKVGGVREEEAIDGVSDSLSRTGREKGKGKEEDRCFKCEHTVQCLHCLLAACLHCSHLR